MTHAIKRHLLQAVFLVPFIVNAAPALADNDGPFFGQYAAGKWMIGAKAAKVQNGSDGFKDGNGTGLILGYEFARPVGYDGSVSIEVELLKSGNAAVDPASSFLSGARSVNGMPTLQTYSLLIARLALYILKVSLAFNEVRFN